MVLINIYVNIPLYLLIQFDVSSRIFENGLKSSLRGEHVVKENGGHGHAMGAPHPGLWGTVGQKYVVGRRGMGSKTCMSLTVRHKQHTGAHSKSKAEHKRAQAAQGSA